MPRRIVPLLLCLTYLATSLPAMAGSKTAPPATAPAATARQATARHATARSAQAHIDRITTGVATLDDVRVRLDWHPGATQGQLSVWAGKVVAPDLGYRFHDLQWQCPLQRDGNQGWRCDGTVRSGRGSPLRLTVDLGTASTEATLTQGASTLALHRSAATPDDTALDLAKVPLVWAQALLSQGWADGQLKSGTLDGHLRVHVPEAPPLQVVGTLSTAGAGFDTPDATIAGEGLAGRFDIDYRKWPARTMVTVDGKLHGGELLAGNAYLALPGTPVGLHVAARRAGEGGWQLPRFDWNDGDALVAQGSAAFDTDANLQALDLQLHSRDVAPLRKRYLSGWLGLFDLGELQMRGALDARLDMVDGRLQAAQAWLHDIDLVDPRGRFRFDGLNGKPGFSATTPVSSELRWRGGQLYGLDFSAATLPIDSRNGVIRLRKTVSVPAFGGSLRFDDLVLRPPKGDEGLRMRFGLGLDRLDIGKIAKALGLPAFEGELSGSIPTARYANEHMDFEGGLTMQLFDGQVQVSSLSLERPFGVAPSLSANLALDDLDLAALTGVFDFGTITGRLDGRISGLRLVDWTATAFDAELHTDADQARRRGVRQRISQRAVQNISSVGDASFVNSLQGKLIGFFDDFGYRQVGISCRLANEVCLMGGLHPAEPSRSLSLGASVEPGSRTGFTIVEGAGIPRLRVVGFNRRVDWPTLLERLEAVGKGEVSPVVQ